jgi:hypothetical protein
VTVGIAVSSKINARVVDGKFPVTRLKSGKWKLAAKPNRIFSG